MIKKNVFKSPILIPYITFGDPSPEDSEALLLASFDAGAGLVELGIPFSDPVADGPVIQASHQRALATGEDCGIDAAFKTVARVKAKVDKPIVFMMACNLTEFYGVDAFFENAAKHGLDGVIIPDLPVEGAKDYIASAKKHKVALIFLVSPLCEPARMKALVKASSGFVYLISSTGTTGERAEMSAALAGIVDKIKAIKDIPVCVGFGISQKAHVDEVAAFADGAIVGSHLVKQVATYETPVDQDCFASAIKALL